jgi:hypothetical protein
MSRHLAGRHALEAEESVPVSRVELDALRAVVRAARALNLDKVPTHAYLTGSELALIAAVRAYDRVGSEGGAP